MDISHGLERLELPHCPAIRRFVLAKRKINLRLAKISQKLPPTAYTWLKVLNDGHLHHALEDNIIPIHLELNKQSNTFLSIDSRFEDAAVYQVACRPAVANIF